MIHDEGFDPSQLMRGEALRPGQRDGIEPELRQPPFALHVSMCRLQTLVAVEEEPIGANTRYRRHGLHMTPTGGQYLCLSGERRDDGLPTDDPILPLLVR